MKNFNEQHFLEDLSQVKWREIINNANNIDDAVQNWTKIFTVILNKHASVLNRRVSDKYTPWLNSDFFTLTKMRKSKSKILMDSYRQIRNQANKLNVQLKREYFSNKIVHCNGDLKQTWQTINQVINKKSNSTAISSLKVGGKVLKANAEIAASMNEYFCTVGSKLSDDIPSKPCPLLINLDSQRGFD